MSDLHITVYLDGTRNNKDNDAPEGAHTNVARLYDLDTAQGTNLARNSGGKPQQYDASARSGQSEKVYIDGVGSQKNNPLGMVFEGATGAGGQSRIEQAYDTLVAFHNKYPDLAVDVNVVGFSRGAAQARALANVFIDRGVPMLDSQFRVTDQYLIPPGQPHVNKLGIFDTVASFGNAKTDTHLNKNLEISGNIDSTTHLVAMNEYRDTFPLTSALRNDDNSRIEELKFAGAHSQVGGGYKHDVLAAGPLAVMYDRLQTAGIEMRPMLPEDVKRVEQYNVLIKDPAQLQEALIDSRLSKGNDAFQRSADGQYTVVDNAPFPFERATFNYRDRQTRPFQHEVEGRRVIFENDDSLSRPAIQRMGEKAGQWLTGWASKLVNGKPMVVEPGPSLNEAMASRSQDYEAQAAQRQAAVREQVAQLSASLADSKPNKAYLEGLALEPVPVPVPGAGPAPRPVKPPSYAVVRIDPEGSAAFSDLGFEYEASRIVADAAIGALARAPLGVDDPFLLHDTNGNVVGTLEAVHEVPAFDAERGVQIAINLQNVDPAAQAGVLYDGFKQASEWIAERPQGTLKDQYEVSGVDGKPAVKATLANPAVPELQKAVAWEAPEP
ncbi:DUF2235 domain-containing protein [Pantoea sp. Tr-811]|uniref:phospholipase effector Tle1 domain-containing protein n=1 Tax=Pantoea sp. Tr-811 TaxID=2608361 RepID=UPI00141F8CCC|nr:DUF2235 domain-containing protein [Pantoea sp. Tr-811]NIF27685.1 DUF2235 domain-containing protein [Pantoea sp. Tr-811]